MNKSEYELLDDDELKVLLQRRPPDLGAIEEFVRRLGTTDEGRRMLTEAWSQEATDEKLERIARSLRESAIEGDLDAIQTLMNQVRDPEPGRLAGHVRAVVEKDDYGAIFNHLAAKAQGGDKRASRMLRTQLRGIDLSDLDATE